MTRRGGEEEDAEVEEVTAEEFAGSRVWRAADLMPFRGSFGPNLYNYAWAQAVQNKPLIPAAKPQDENDNVVLVEDEDGVDVEEEEGEKEEGEIEEGEIDEIMTVSVPDEPEMIAETPEKEADEKDEIGEFDRRVSLILEDLETVTEEEAKMSLEAVCARLRKSFENLKWMHTESQVPIIDALVQQAVMGMHTVHAVVVSSKLKKNEDLLLRLIIHIKNQYSILLASEQLKELDEMVQSLVYSDHRESNTNVSASHGSVSSGKPLLDPRAGSSSVSISGKPGLPIMGTPTVNRKGVEFSPLLDLHAEHDEGSLPSPTRENAPPLQTPFVFGGGIAVPAQPIPSNGSFKPYDTDAFKAVSSYQQKYSQNSFSSINRFPSPTPSEDNDGNDDANDDVHTGEVSSAPVVYNARDANFASISQHGSSYSGETAAPPGFPSATFKTPGQFISGPPATVKVPANSRDPRLRIFNPEASGTSRNRPQMPMNSNPTSEPAGGSLNARKRKTIEEPLMDGHNLKRQRNGVADSRNMQLTPGRGGWLEESSHMAPQFVNRNAELEIRKPGNVQTVPNQIYNAMGNFHGTKGGIGQNLSVPSAPAVSTSTANPVLLPPLLKDIALNPTMLLQLLQSQLKTADAARNFTSTPNSNRFPATVSAENGATSKITEREHTLAEKSQLPVQTILLNNQNDVGVIRMKPRDPRRILHNNTVPKSESLKQESAKVIRNLSSDTLSNKDQTTVREQGEQAQTSGLPSQPPPQPDIARQFTTNLKSVANMISGTKAANTSSTVPQIASQPIPAKLDKVDVMVDADLNGQKNVSGLASEGGIAGASQEPSPWGDVDHLLDGCDDKQKADIQRERVRRIEEQNTMFAARKLCLVLDLDHTLLNSAKFTEVDLIHDELLRKKEELDRENQYRHLFRFPHMGMWTKLRPGVWNFLERASKFFELHLYTMGNKLYATEMAKVLDPTGVLFAGRVISRGDDNDLPDADERVPKTKDLDGVLGLESAVVIIDDSVRVWPHNKLNLIVVERYTYFPCSRRQFGLPGPSLLEIDHDERPEAGTLASSLAVIERIHTCFFSHRSLHDVDVRSILAAEQRKILAGCRVVFSRIFPVGEVSPQTHPLWQTAEQFGAVCTNQIDEHVTHVVANSLGTDKVNWALCTGRFVVQPGWVEASALLYRRANEHDFSVKI